MRKDDLRIVVLSDTHGYLPYVPSCDLLILSGDMAPDMARIGTAANGYRQIGWFNTEFRTWLNSIDAKEVVATPGNHDFGLHRLRYSLRDDIRWHLLIDDGIELFGQKIYGSPWVGNLQGWAFNTDEQILERKWANIPDDADIVVLHSPPYGFGDQAYREKNGLSDLGYEHTGSPSLLARLPGLKAKLITFGHIHEGRGNYRFGDITLMNAAFLDRNYQPVNKPSVFQLDHLDELEVISLSEEVA